MLETSTPFYASFSLVADLFDGVVYNVLEEFDGEERWFSFWWEGESILCHFH